MNLSPRTQLRLLGLLPLFFFFAQGAHYWRINQLGHMLWMCNIGNLMLAAGLFLEMPTLVRVAAIWTIPGLLIWFVYVVLAWGIFLTSTLAHVGGLAVAAIALKTYRMDRNGWRYAFGWALLVQLVSRFATPPQLNVNLAHSVQPGWEHIFPSYWIFWLASTLLMAFGVWSAGLVWRTVWRTAESSPRTATILF